MTSAATSRDAPSLAAGSSRRALAVAAIAYAAFAVYGSLVPLRYTPLDWPTAVGRFRAIPWLELATDQRADWVANALLFIPLGFLATGALAGNRRGWRALIAAAIVALGCAALSGAIEFAQLWFPPRTVSQNDIAAEAVGGVVGVVLWLAMGRGVMRWVQSCLGATGLTSRLDKLLAAYCVGLAVFAILPLDLTISATEIYEKYRAGRINFVPFANNLPLGWLSVYELLRDAAIALPVGLFAYRALAPSTPARRMAYSIALGMAAMVAVEFIQLLVFSRYADVTDIISGGCGVALGAFIGRRLDVGDGRSPAAKPMALAGAARGRTLAILLALLAVHSAILLATAWYPLEFNFDPAFLKPRIQALVAAPLTTLYYSAEFSALVNAIKHAAWFIPFGALSTAIANVLCGDRVTRRAVLCGFFLAALCLGLAMELGQLAIPSRTPSLDGVLLRGLGTLLGMATLGWLMPPRWETHGAAAAHRAAPLGGSVATGSSEARPARISGLDGLRGFAAFTVFLENLGNFVAYDARLGPFDWHRFAFSGIGVCIFFVLSGFLLTRSYWQSPATWPTWSAPGTYVWRRAARLLPVYFVCLFGLVVVKRYWSTPTELLDVGLHTALVHNFAEFSFYGINDPFWTIAVQVQFYLLLPLLMLVAHKIGRRPGGVFVALVGLSLGCYALHYAVMTAAARVEPWPFDPQWVKPDGFVLGKSTLAHLPIFLVGCAMGFAAHAMAKRAAPSGLERWTRCGAFWIAFAVAAAMTTTRLEEAWAPPWARYGFPLLPLAVAAIVLCVRDSGILWLLELAPLRLAGVISYSLFIFHFPCLKAVHTIGDLLGAAWLQSAWGLGVVGLLVSLAVATVGYFLLEAPLEHYFRRDKSRVAPPVAAATVA